MADGFDILEWFSAKGGQAVHDISGGLKRIPIVNSVRFGSQLTPYGQPTPLVGFTPQSGTSGGFTQNQFTGSRETGAGYNGPGANRSVHQGRASDAWGRVQSNIARARFNELKAGLEQLRNAQGGGGGGAGAIINARIKRAEEELAEGNQAFDQFFEDIAPGFEEALDQAGRIAEAEAAIEGHFKGTQEAVDERYATAEGAVLAIADSMGNNTTSLQETLKTSVNEFKEFIDEDLHLEATQAQALNAAASSLAAAAAEAANQQARGAGARDQFVFQKRYEKIIQNLLDQRAAASGARGNALAGAAQQLLANFRSSQPYTRQQMGQFVMFNMVDQIVPPAQQNLAYEAIKAMRSTGLTSFDAFRQALMVPTVRLNLDGQEVETLDWASELDKQTWMALAPFADVIESAVNRSTQKRIDELYNQAFTDPQSAFDQFNVGRQEAFDAGFSFGEATDYSNQQLLTTGLGDIASIEQLLTDLGIGGEFEGLFGSGLGG